MKEGRREELASKNALHPSDKSVTPALELS